jgi:hypothetical protein
MFYQLVMANVSSNLKKCRFGCTEGIQFGDIISQGKICTYLANIEKVKNLPFPKTKRQL